VVQQLRSSIAESIQRIAAHVQPPEQATVADSRYALETESWVNVSPAGAFHTLHSHPGFSFSGVYYVASGAPSPSSAGRLEFADPRANTYLPGLDHSSVAAMSIAPEPGALIIFPAWLQHTVTPHHGSAERISVAFNVRLKAIARPDAIAARESESALRPDLD
jgi:uncharacterized protein (TIGR02466 family)